MNSKAYKKKQQREKDWYTNQKKKDTLVKIILHSRLFYHPVRNSFNYVFPKKQMKNILRRKLRKKAENLLVAPCGGGDDYVYIKKFAKNIHGIDLSDIAVKQCPKEMKCKVGDILKSGYANDSFDIIVSPLIFHHFLKFGFSPFLKEFHRILNKNGKLVILEPSVYYPLNILTRPIKKIFKNPYGEVEDEAPFRPKLMLNALKKTGFKNIEIKSASFSHCSTYVPLAKIVNIISKPFLGLWPFKYFGWMVVYYAEKK